MRYILLIAVLLVAVSDLWAQKVKYPQDFTPQSRARLRNDIDIRDYGANGYDTISDETAIESAINAAPDGSVISLSEGKEMRRTYSTQFVLLLATIMLLSCGVFSEAAENKDKSNAPDSAQPQPGLSEERVDRIINRLKQTDSEKAEELEKLRQEDPEKFKAELNETMRARFAEKVKKITSPLAAKAPYTGFLSFPVKIP